MKHNLNINFELLDSIFKIMLNRHLTLSVAESCTGGLVSTFLTSKSGASIFFKGSTINYSNESKIKILGLKKSLINKYGVVSQYVVEEMASSVRSIHNTDYGLATTGYLDFYNEKSCNTHHNLQAWISVASQNKVVSEHIILNQNRLENARIVSCSLLNLFRKEIL